MNSSELQNLFDAANERLRINPPICFYCQDRIANAPMAIVADEIKFGAPMDGSRMVIVGICVVCEMLTSPDDLKKAAGRLLERM